MRKSAALVCIIVLAGLGLSVQDARAQGFSCTAPAGNVNEWPAIAGLIDQTTGRTADSRVAALVQQYQSSSIGSADIVNRLVTAYCTDIAKIAGLSAGQRGELTRRFARQVTGYVYADASLGQISILIDVPLSQELLDRVDAAASAKRIPQDQWIKDAIEKGLSTN